MGQSVIGPPPPPPPRRRAPPVSTPFLPGSEKKKGRDFKKVL